MADAIHVRVDGDERLLAQLREAGWWMRVDVRVRARFRCEYCNINAIQEYEVYEHGQGDHILPKAKDKYPELAHVPANIAYVCLTCHKAKNAKTEKSGYDPNHDGDIVYERGTGQRTDEQRKKLIERCKQHVTRVREQMEHPYVRYRQIVEAHWAAGY